MIEMHDVVRRTARRCLPALLALLPALGGCAGSQGVIPGVAVPSLPSQQMTAARGAIVAAASRAGSVPRNARGELLVQEAIRERSRTMDTTDGGGAEVKVTETIDAVAYDYRPARNRFMIALAGRVVNAPEDGGTPQCTWYSLMSTFEASGALVSEQSKYVENGRLFIVAMRNTAQHVPWNCEAWAITQIHRQASRQSGAAQADAMVESLLADALRSGEARVLRDKTPREMAFGGSAAGAAPPAPN